jgi:pimeloyl-ACP methyl ester carboxylesterase
MPYVHANGLDIGYEVSGAGPPLIALHGATGSGRDDFAALRRQLSAAFTVHLPDARGHATTRWDVTTGGFHAESLIDDIEAFADALGIETFHLVGFSMGGVTALGFAARAPERVRTLVVIAASPQREPRASVVRHELRPERIEAEDRVWAKVLAARHDPIQGEGAWRDLLRGIVDDVATQHLLTPREVRGITAPTLVVCGDRDSFVPVMQAADLARQVQDGRLLVLPRCGHDVLRTRPAGFDEVLSGFYRSTEPVARRRAESAREVTR